MAIKRIGWSLALALVASASTTWSLAPRSRSILAAVAGVSAADYEPVGVARFPMAAREVSGQDGVAPGWPVHLGTPTNGQPYTPTLFDIDGDGAAEIFVTGGETFGLRGNGSFLQGWPTREMESMGYGVQGQVPGPSVGDLDGDGTADVLWSLRDWYFGSSRTWSFNARRLDGSNVRGFPQAAPGGNSYALFGTFVVGDTSGDGFVAAAVPHSWPDDGVLTRITFFSAGGGASTTTSIGPPCTENACHSLQSVHFGDLDGDGREEFFAVSQSWNDWSIYLHAFDSEGREKAGYPRLLVTTSATNLEHAGGYPIAANLDRLGDLEILIAYSGASGYIDCFHHDARRCNGFPINVGYGIQVIQLALGNLEGGSSPDHLVVLAWHRLEQIYQLIAIDMSTGTRRRGWPVTLPDSVHPAAIHPGVPIIFDANGDGVQDVCIAHVDGRLYVLSGSGTLLPGYPKQMRSPSISGAAVADIDGDGSFEIVAATWDGWVYAWKTSSPARQDRADWPMRAADARNTGVYRRRGGSVQPPGAPSNLAASVSGSTVALVWNAPTPGGAPTTYVVQAGSRPGASDRADFATGSAATTYRTTNVPDGTYYVRVGARNGAGTSGPSNEVTVVVPCTTAPGAPSDLTFGRSGNVVTLTWTAPTSGAAPSTYVLQVGSAPGLSNLMDTETGTTATTFVGSAPSGTYYVRVRARNACGTSGASNEVTVVIS